MASKYIKENYDQEEAKKYYQKNKSKIAEQRKVYYENNKKKIHEYHREYMMKRMKKLNEGVTLTYNVTVSF